MRFVPTSNTRYMVAHMRKRIVCAAIVMGFSGIVAQIVLLRELMIAFLGNELSIGVILANWLILESAGAFFLGKRISRARKRLFWFILVTILFSFFFVAAVHAARAFKALLPLLHGEGMGIVHMFAVSFLILLPVSLLHGALFTSGCTLYSVYSRPANNRSAQNIADAVSISRVYIYETLGTIAGGVLLTYLFIPWLHSINIAFVLALLNTGICALLMEPFWKPKLSLGMRAASFATFGLIALIVFVVAGPVADRINRTSVQRQWQNQNLVHYQNSQYGNLVVVAREDQYTFFADGVPVITAPNPDIAFTETFVHFAMLSHPDPRNLLILSGGAGGVINEALKHDPQRIDYAEVDPLLPKILRKFPTPLTEKELNDERVYVQEVDGRFFLKRTPHKYDVIFSGFTDPSTLQTNRFFTREFSILANNSLNSGGILVLAIPGSLTYISPELANLNALTYNTLQEVFSHIRVIPGDGINIYLATHEPEIAQAGYAVLAQRMQDRKLDAHLITPGYLEYRMNPRWLAWFYDQMEGSTGQTNSDFRPLGVFYSLIYWNEKFSPAFNTVFKRIESLNAFKVLGAILVFSVVFSLFALRSKKPLQPALTLCMFSTGFAGMLFDLILIFAFQVLYGYIFYWLGLLVTAFMAGVMVGGMYMAAFIKKSASPMPALIRIEIVLIVFALLLPFVFLHAGSLLVYAWFDYALRLVFLLLSFLSGIMVGAEFPLANSEYLRSSTDLSKTAGLLYSADLMGGWLGGMAGSVVLLPLLGLFQTVIALVMLKICSLALLVLAYKKQPHRPLQ